LTQPPPGPVDENRVTMAAPPANLGALVEFARTALHVSAGREHVMRAAVDQVRAALDDRATVWLHQVDDGVPGTGLAVGDHDPELRAAIEAACPHTGDPLVLDAGTPGDWLADHGLAQCALIPVRHAGHVLGAMAVTRAAGRPRFRPDELDLVGAIADLAGVVAEQSRMLADSLVALDEMRQLVEVVDNISDALVSCDAGHQIVSWNSGAEQIYGYPRSEALGCDLFALLATQFFTSDGVEVRREEVLSDVTLTNGWRGELRQRRADGAPLVIMASLSGLLDPLGHPAGLVAVNRDVTAQRHEEHRALHDALTGLPNRRRLDNALYEAFARACRTAHTLAVLFIDLDGFKPINDTYGHASGDVVLRATAERLVAELRSRDTVARLGGDEFVVVLEEAGNTGAVESVARRVADILAVPIDIGDLCVSVKASIGVAVVEKPDAGGQVNAKSLLEAADQAMYVAKRERTGISFAP
jgi:diguanylate cyclase (GGDEF)-like protein/PAS domain S-box-containing protein